MRAKDTDEEEGEGRSSSSSGGGGGSSWHRRLGGASLAQVVAAASVASEAGGARRRRWTSASGEGGGGSEALASLVTVACSQLRDAEPRVRHAAAGLLGTLAAASSSNRGGDDAGDETVSVSASASSSSSESFPPVWLLGARDAIFDIVERDWDRDEEEEEEEGGGKKKEKEEAGGGGPVATADGGGGRDGKKSSLIGAALSAAYARPRPGRGELRHGSEGWHCLETALVALLSVADGCGTAFAPVARGRRAEVRSLVLRSLLHPNRFVREAGYGLLGGLCALAGSVGELDRWGAEEAGAEEAEETALDGGDGKAAAASPAPQPPLSSPTRSRSFADAAAAALADGLSENWSQVRLAACVAARSLLAAAAADDEANNRGGGSEIDIGSSPSPSSSSSSLHSRLLARLLPQLAFNRYDAAEGVRHYSNATWLLHTRGKGRDWVRARSGRVFDFYLRCSRANNHMVRESAAVCVGELFSKVGGGGGETTREGGKAARDEVRAGSSSPPPPSQSVRSLVPRALQLLLSAARDDAWPVRDEGGRALAGLLTAFPEEVLSSAAAAAAAGGAGGGGAAATRAAEDPSLPVLDSLVQIWRGNLEDNVPSVRDGAAVSMASALEGLSKRAREEEEEREGEGEGGKNGSIVSSAACRLSSAIEKTIRERLPRAAQQPPGECAGAPNAVPFRIQQAPTAVPGKAFFESSFSGSKASSPPATAGGDGPSDDASLFAPSDLLSRRRDTGGVDFSCGCMDYGFRRPVEPWEQSDGAARLLREWSRVEGEAAKALALADALADSSRQQHFAAAPALRETVWGSLPVIARNVGIRAFKTGMLELFLGPLVECLEAGGGGAGEARRTGGGGHGGGGHGESARSIAAAGAALGALRDAMGPRIFAGRLEERQRRVVEASAVVPPPAGAFAHRGGGGGAGGGALRLGGGAGTFFGGAPTTARTLPPPSSSSPSPHFPLPLGAGARPEGYCPGGMPLRK